MHDYGQKTIWITFRTVWCIVNRIMRKDQIKDAMGKILRTEALIIKLQDGCRVEKSQLCTCILV